MDGLNEAPVAAVGDVRAFLRIEGPGEAALIARLVTAAVALGEAFTGAVFVHRTVEEVVAVGDGCWHRLAKAPVMAIHAVEGIAADGAASVLAADGYAIDIDADGVGQVRVAGMARVRVRYVAGLASEWSCLPGAIAHGVVMLAAHLFEDRERNSAPPAAVAALWRPHRRLRLMQRVAA